MSVLRGPGSPPPPEGGAEGWVGVPRGVGTPRPRVEGRGIETGVPGWGHVSGGRTGCPRSTYLWCVGGVVPLAGRPSWRSERESSDDFLLGGLLRVVLGETVRPSQRLEFR